MCGSHVTESSVILFGNNMSGSTTSQWYQWVFSGIGVLLLSWFGMWIFRRYLRKQEKPGFEQHIEGEFVHSSSQVKISDSTVNGPVAGGHMQIGTYVQQINPRPEQQNDKYSERPTPTEIIDSIRKVALFNQKSVANGYVGCKVRWQARLSDIHRIPKQDDMVDVTLTSEPRAVWISTTVRLSEYPLLKNLKEDEPVEVAGTIAHVATSGGDVELADATLKFRDTVA